MSSRLKFISAVILSIFFITNISSAFAVGNEKDEARSCPAYFKRNVTDFIEKSSIQYVGKRALNELENKLEEPELQDLVEKYGKETLKAASSSLISIITSKNDPKKVKAAMKTIKKTAKKAFIDDCLERIVKPILKQEADLVLEMYWDRSTLGPAFILNAAAYFGVYCVSGSLGWGGVAFLALDQSRMFKTCINWLIGMADIASTHKQEFTDKIDAFQVRSVS